MSRFTWMLETWTPKLWLRLLCKYFFQTLKTLCFFKLCDILFFSLSQNHPLDVSIWCPFSTCSEHHVVSNCFIHAVIWDVTRALQMHHVQNWTLKVFPKCDSTSACNCSSKTSAVDSFPLSISPGPQWPAITENPRSLRYWSSSREHIWKCLTYGLHNIISSPCWWNKPDTPGAIF